MISGLINKIYNYGVYTLYGVYNGMNIFRLMFNILIFIGYSKITGKYSDRLLDNILYTININGYISIKFTQWLTSRMLLMETDRNKIRVLKRLENIYENCHTHPERETEYLYKQDFNNNIKDRYDLLEIIGSGSIGQVYKAKDLQNNRICAIKVKHYNIEKKYMISYLFIKIIVLLFKLYPYLNY
tara:strand:- start:37 stop:591 length:555 start_codon:yes stop_codon:yes gene_type:complete